MLCLLQASGTKGESQAEPFAPSGQASKGHKEALSRVGSVHSRSPSSCKAPDLTPGPLSGAPLALGQQLRPGLVQQASQRRGWPAPQG